ncbi:MAG TPA: helix-turn-helix domain-containing protein [Hymenobacter sp.]|nr:helix-turn-helix domain-containing protein [Hymenobacter sp.]
MNAKLYTIKEVMAILSVSQSTVYRMMYSGQLPRVMIGRSVRIPADVVHEIAKTGVAEIPAVGKEK